MGLQCCRQSRDGEDGTAGGENNISAPLSSLAQVMLYHTFYSKLTDAFHIQITISELELYYKHWDNFGLVFHPYIQLSLPSNQENIFLNDANNDKLNMTSSNANTNVSNVSYNQMDMSNSVLSVINPENKRMFSFEYVKAFTCQKEDLYGMIDIKVKNEMWTCNKDGSNNLKGITFNYNNDSNEEELAIIGEGKIPINLIANTNGDKIFCGNMCLMHRGLGVIGHLYLKIVLSDKDFEENKEDNNNILGDIDKEEEKEQKNDLNMDIKYPYENNPVHFYFYDCDKMKKNFNITMTNEQIESALKFISEIDKSDKFNNEYVKASFDEFYNQNNLLLGYELFIYLYKNCKITSNVQFIDEFINANLPKEKLFEILHIIEYNSIIMKPYLLLVYNYLKYKKPDAPELYEKFCIEIYKHLLDLKASFDGETTSEGDTNLMYDNLQLSLNIYIELLNNDSFETIYISCGSIVDNMDNIICQIIERFIDNSEIVFTVMRLLRKVFRVVTDEIKVDALPKHIVNDISSIRRNIIKKSTLLEKLQKVVKKYYHYPEMLSNILQIIVNLCNELSNVELNELYEKFNFDLLSDKFVYYLAKMKYISKDLNQLFLELLDNLTEMPKTTEFEDVDELLDNDKNVDSTDGICEDYNDKMLKITKEIIAFYQRTKKYPDFITKASQYIYYHLLISSIGYNICSIQEFAYMLANSTFYSDSASFLMKFNDASAARTFVKEAIEKNSKRTQEKEIRIMISDTISAILRILVKTLLTSMNEVKKQCIDVLKRNKDTKPLSNSNDIEKIANNILKNCKDNKLDVEEIEHLLDLFKENYSKQKQDNSQYATNKSEESKKETNSRKENQTEEDDSEREEESKKEETEENKESEDNPTESNKNNTETEEKEDEDDEEGEENESQPEEQSKENNE